MKKSILIAAALGSAALVNSAPAAASFSLNFEGINTTRASGHYANVLEFYNGGTSSDGTTGTNYGISFGSNARAICLNVPGSICSNTSHGGLGDPSSAQTGLFFTDGSTTYLNSAAGFTTGFSFNYTSVSFSGSVNVYDGPNGTGNILATLNLSPNASGCDSTYSASFCPFGPSGVLFSGTAHSIGFGGVANQIVFDDITFGSDRVGGAVPEPASWAMMLVGFGCAGVALRRRRRKERLALA